MFQLNSFKITADVKKLHALINFPKQTCGNMKHLEFNIGFGIEYLKPSCKLFSSTIITIKIQGSTLKQVFISLTWRIMNAISSYIYFLFQRHLPYFFYTQLVTKPVLSP